MAAPLCFWGKSTGPQCPCPCPRDQSCPVQEPGAASSFHGHPCLWEPFVLRQLDTHMQLEVITRSQYTFHLVSPKGNTLQTYHTMSQTRQLTWVRSPYPTLFGFPRLSLHSCMCMHLVPCNLITFADSLLCVPPQVGHRPVAHEDPACYPFTATATTQPLPNSW